VTASAAPGPTSAPSAGQCPTSDLGAPPNPRTGPTNRWLAATGGTRGPAYAERFRRLAERGEDVHGEARLLDGLLRREVAGPARVLDAGCGTGRVALELARRGHHVVGLDIDESMLDEARAASRAAALEVRWLHGDLVDLAELVGERGFDLVAAPGNVLVYLTPGTEPDVVTALAEALRPGGLLVAGFALDRHVSRADYAGWCEAAGLEHVRTLASWDGAEAQQADEDYAVHVHRRPRGRL
jgi:SAM-dependent methyltransferase